MNTRNMLFGAVLGAILPAVADDAMKDRVTFGYRAAFRINADFHNVGSSPVAGGPSLGASYGDGYVRTDNTGNAGGLTTNWGYDSADQVSGGNLYLRGSQDGVLGKDSGSDFNHGLEITYGRYLGTLGKGRWGLELGFNYTAVDIDVTHRASRGVLTVDAFDLGGIVPPQAPYPGPFTAGPGVPLLPSDGTPTTASVAHHLDSTLYGFKLGPFWELPLGDRITFGVGVGFTLLVADSEYSFVESYGGVSRRGSGSRSELLPGGYASATLACRVADHLSIESGVQLQGADSTGLRVMDKQADLDLGLVVLWTLGLRWEF